MLFSGGKKVKSIVHSDTGTRTLVSCVKGKYANHLHHIGIDDCLLYIIPIRAIKKKELFF